ncbi:MAG: hypothetical protein M1837_007388 [Sclerophora amabilis]|nr:MAG: hypothetical protein M1837_007388 [Sclerophora amabilis]
MFATLRVSKDKEHGSCEVFSVERASLAPFGSGHSLGQQHSACNNCRVKKLKCTGQKTGCDRCQSKGITCFFQEPGPVKGRKRKRTGNSFTDDGLGSSVSQSSSTSAGKRNAPAGRTGKPSSVGVADKPDVPELMPSTTAEVRLPSSSDATIATEISISQDYETWRGMEGLAFGSSELFMNYANTGDGDSADRSRSAHCVALPLTSSLTNLPVDSLAPSTNLSFLMPKDGLPHAEYNTTLSSHINEEGNEVDDLSGYCEAHGSTPPVGLVADNRYCDLNNDFSTLASLIPWSSSEDSPPCARQTLPSLPPLNIYGGTAHHRGFSLPPGIEHIAMRGPNARHASVGPGLYLSTATTQSQSSPCDCMQTALEILAKLESKNCQVSVHALDEILSFKKCALVQCHNILRCTNCNPLLEFTMLLVVICEKMISSFERLKLWYHEHQSQEQAQRVPQASPPTVQPELVTGPSLDRGAQGLRSSISFLRDYEVNMTDEWAHRLGRLFMLQLRNLRSLVVRLSRLTTLCDWESHGIMLASIDRRVMEEMRNVRSIIEAGAARDPSNI